MSSTVLITRFLIFNIEMFFHVEMLENFFFKFLSLICWCRLSNLLSIENSVVGTVDYVFLEV